MELFLNDKFLDENFGQDSKVFNQFFYELSEKKKIDPHFRRKFEENYEIWNKSFLIFYSAQNLTEDLFFKHLYCVIIIKEIFCNLESSLDFNRVFPELSGSSYFGWFTEFFSDFHINTPISDQLKLNSTEQNHKSYPIFGDFFHLFYQKLVSPKVRHNLGEFYTPPDLASKMVVETYEFGQKIMDPACGTGVFLIEILKIIIFNTQHSLDEKKKAAKNVFGFDINPLACALARMNIILALHLSKIDFPWQKIQIYHESVLFWENKYFSVDKITHKFDLIIGNPAWITIKSMQHLKYKEKVKKLASKLGFKPKPHQVPNIEISALFFFQSREFLVRNGVIALVVSNAFITGSNHAITRTFPEFDGISIWSFDLDIFSVPHICIFARYSPRLIRSESELNNLELENLEFSAHKEGNNWNFHLKERYFLIPSRIKRQNSRLQVQKLIKKEEKKNLQSLLPHGNNSYYRLSHRGADIFPRSLLSILPQFESSGKLVIVPQNKESKANWDFDLESQLKKYPDIYHFGKISVESRYIFPILKSKHLIPFAFTHFDYAFIPIELDGDSHRYRKIQEKNSKGWHYYQILEQIFQENHKSGAAIRSLWERINFHNNLTNPRHLSPIKVVYQRSGSYVKAALLLDPHVIVDTTNYFLKLSSIDEAYYVMGFLNAPDLTKAVRIEKSARDIHKLPFTFFLPDFDLHNPLHQKLVMHSQNMERKVKSIANLEIESLLKRNNSSLKKENYYNLTILKELKTRHLQTKIYQILGWNVKKDQIIGDFAELNKIIWDITHER
ncbi:MAG: HsdM family class I SAM-dependent methyltransferase [Promethearchaeota archaeon]